MIKNANIRATLEDMLDVLDMRGTVNIFTSETQSIKYADVYEVIADKEFINIYGEYKVSAFNIETFGNVVNILIEEV